MPRAWDRRQHGDFWHAQLDPVSPVAVANPEQLVSISRGQIATFSYPAFRDFQTRSRTLSGLTTSFPMESDLDLDGESEFVTAEVVSANYGDVFGIRPSFGRWFADDAEPLAVILAVGLTRALGSVEVDIRPADLSTHVATIAIWMVIALLACYWPAARASRVDPLVALRCE